MSRKLVSNPHHKCDRESDSPGRPFLFLAISIETVFALLKSVLCGTRRTRRGSLGSRAVVREFVLDMHLVRFYERFRLVELRS
jgi:hypothetical protein